MMHVLDTDVLSELRKVRHRQGRCECGGTGVKRCRRRLFTWAINVM